MARFPQHGVLFGGGVHQVRLGRLDAETLTSGAGMVLLVEVDHALGLTEGLGYRVR